MDWESKFLNRLGAERSKGYELDEWTRVDTTPTVARCNGIPMKVDVAVLYICPVSANTCVAPIE
jgi:hypothetical protein